MVQRMSRMKLYWQRSSEHLLVLLLLCSLVVLALWPWPLHFSTGFPDHFDPPFHAWKLQVDADKLLQDHKLVPDTNTNIYYPYANELYFDALLWPQGIVAALLKVAGCGPVLSYNIIFLFFWGLSGLFMYLLLRELDLERLPSFFGAAAMCLIPYRVSYYVEFNMQMCFGLPLFLFFWVRYAKRPGVWNAVGLALAFWLQAVSELYQAVILVLIFPLLALPFLPEIFRKYGRSRRLYISIAAGLVTVVPLCLLYLGPYFSLFKGGYGRKTKEMMAHSLEPLAYLGKTLTELFFHLDFQSIKTDEMSVFPSLTLLILVVGYSLYSRRIIQPGMGKSEGWPVYLHWLRLIAVVSFVILLRGLCLSNQPEFNARLLYAIGNGTLILLLVSTIILVFFTEVEGRAARLSVGLAAAASLCFILSLGPYLRVHSDIVAENLVFSFVSTFFPLSGFRVMSRFSIIVMIFLIVAAARFLSILVGREKQKQFLIILLIAALLTEAYAIPHRYKKFSLPISESSLALLKNCKDRTVTVIPLGRRFLDARYMLAIGGTRTLLVNGFGGFSPLLQTKIGHTLRFHPLLAWRLIRSIWPESLLVVYKEALKSLNAYGYATTEAGIREQAVLIAEDHSFSIYELKDLEKPMREYRRFVRGDILRANRSFTFEAKSLDQEHAGQKLFVFFNGTVIGSVPLDVDWRSYEISIPETGITNVDYEMIFLRAGVSRTWTARHGTFHPLSPDLGIVVPDYQALADQALATNNPAWPNYVTSLSGINQSPARRFAGGIEFKGLSLASQVIIPGQRIEMRYYWTRPPELGRLPLLVRTEMVGPEGYRFTTESPLLAYVPLTFLASQPVRKIFFERRAMRIPPTAPLGKYLVNVSLVNKKTGKVMAGKRIASGRRTGTLGQFTFSIQGKK